jgi:hypothetical protein
MKHAVQLTAMLALLGTLFYTCKKAPADPGQSEDQALIQSAKAYFEAHLQQAEPVSNGNNRVRAGKKPFWQAAYSTTTTKGLAVVVPVFYQKDLVVKTSFSGSRIMSLNYLTKLVMYKEDAGFQAQLATFFPDSAYGTSTTGQFSGYLFLETWDGTPLKQYKVSQGQVLTNIASDKSAASGTQSSDSTKQVDVIIAHCTTIYGYNYSADDPGEF